MKDFEEKMEYVISVIIPAYNCEKYIGKAIESVFNQKIDSIEIICIDDNSSDHTPEIIKEYSDNDNRIVYIQNTENRGAGYCRNLGLKVSKGKFIHFLDADDWIEENTYSYLIDNMSDDFDFCMFCYTKYDNETGERKTAELFSGINKNVLSIEEDHQFLFNTSVVPWNKFFKKSFLVNNELTFDEISCANDRTFYFTSIVAAKNIKIIERSLIYYRINNPYSLVGSGRKTGFLNHILAFNSSLSKIKSKISDKQFISFMRSALTDLFSFYTKIDVTTETNEMMLRFFKDNREIFDSFPSLGDELAYGPHIKIMLDATNDCEGVSGIIPIVFATNNNYAPYLGVAIQSLIQTKNPDNIYKIYIIHSGLYKRYIDLISSMKTDNCDIAFLCVSKMLESRNTVLYSRAHYSIEMYYRMLIPEIFRIYKKVLYLDCDIIVNEDVYGLFNTDIGENYIGAVINITSNEMSSYINNRLKLAPNKYINSGVMLFNNDMLNANNVTNQFFDKISDLSDLVCPDQDVINMVCQDHIYYLDIKWNFQWYYSISDKETKKLYSLSSSILEQYNNAEFNPFIVHYTSGIKAWKAPEKTHAIYFWDAARKSVFFTEILTKNISQIIDNAVNTRIRIEKEEQRAKLEWNRGERKRLENENMVLLSLIKGNNIGNDFSSLSIEEQQYKYQVEEIRKSFSYKLGLFLTWVPRKIRSALTRKK